ncbi:MAG TPA: AgmX/PglI C-terminal domain-containing protein [Polyangiales bacterium]
MCGACGDKPAAQPVASESSGEERREQDSRDEMGVSGLRGTLSQEEIHNALEPRMLKFARCVQLRSEAVEWLAGRVLLEFHVAIDGRVARVYPRESSMGDRITERCAVEVAQATRFPAPHGGEADFSWSFEVPLDSAIREPVSLGAAELEPEAGALRSAIEGACGSGQLAVTAYVDTSGRVVAAGAAAGDDESAGKLDCVTTAVEAFTFKSPGSYAAKLQLALP